MRLRTAQNGGCKLFVRVALGEVVPKQQVSTIIDNPKIPKVQFVHLVRLDWKHNVATVNPPVLAIV